jgi:hypothetical protein
MKLEFSRSGRPAFRFIDIVTEAKFLRRRLWQAVFIAFGLAIGVGLVLTVIAASAGVKNAQSGVLRGLYGVGTDVTVNGTRRSAPPPGGGSGAGLPEGDGRGRHPARHRESGCVRADPHHARGYPVHGQDRSVQQQSVP